MWSASRPWPVISWKSTPPKPPPTTTGIAPAGAGSASRSSETLVRRLGGDRLGRPVVDELEAPVAAERLEAGLDAIVAPGDHLGAEAHSVRSSAAKQPSELATVTRRRFSP